MLQDAASAHTAARGTASSRGSDRCALGGPGAIVSTTTSSFPPPSGRQFEIRAGSYRAVVAEVGATLRAFAKGDADVIDGFSIDDRAAGGRGQVLAPWPNRLGDGQYTFGGRTGRAPLNEPERSNAIHGLVRWLQWQAVDHQADRVTLSSTLPPQPAYPWRLQLEITYELDASGLTVVTAATNHTDVTAPFGIGFHPYLTVGTPTVDTARLLLPAARRLVTDRRGLPTGVVGVAGTEFDFSRSRPIGPLQLDTAYADLDRTADDQAIVQVASADEREVVTLWLDGTYRYVMAFTGDTLEPGRRRRAIALEPMTCPPDALRSGTDLIRLAPGATWSGCWGLAVTSGAP